MPDKTLSVIVPVFNSERFLGALLTALDILRDDLRTKNVRLQLIFVDDGSKDSSFAILMHRFDNKGDILAIKLTRNFGAISAVKSTFNFITGDAFLFIAADMQDPPTLIPQMVDTWLEGNKYVIARRRRREDTRSANFFARLYYHLLRSSGVSNYPDHGFDLALMDQQFLPYLKQTGKHINIPLFPFWLGFTPVYIDYDRLHIANKKSSWTFRKKFNLAVDSLLAFSRKPTRFLFILGLVTSVVSLFYAGFIIVSALLGQIVVPGFATIIALLSMLHGLTFMFLGIMCEYLWRIFDEVNGHPGAVIDNVLAPTNDRS